MSNELRAVCGIEDTGTAPKFDFDAAVLGPSDRTELDQLARCMTTGPLAGKNLALVGRADPRGEAEYNMTLGARRADAVEHYLAQLGVASSRLVATSRGALDAQGRDEPDVGDRLARRPTPRGSLVRLATRRLPPHESLPVEWLRMA